MGERDERESQGNRATNHRILSLLLGALALFFSYPLIGYFFAPSGIVEPFATKVFLIFIQLSLAALAVLVAVKGGSSNGRKHIAFSLILFFVVLVTVEGFTQLLDYVVEARRLDVEAQSPSNKRPMLSSYAGKEWAVPLFEEFESAYRFRYESYYLWSRVEYHGNYVNIDGNGVRRSWKSSEDPQANERKLFVFGGSTIWGTGARDEETIPSLLARKFREQGHNFTVTNYGESAFTITQEVVKLAILLKEGKRPDWVVFYDGVNDVTAAHRTGLPGVDMQNLEFQTRLLIKPPPPPEYTLREDIYLALTNVFNGHCKTYQLLASIPPIFHKLTTNNRGTPLQEQVADTFDQMIFQEVAASIDEDALEQLADGVVTSYVDAAQLIDGLAKAYGFRYCLFWQPVLLMEPHATEEEKDFQRIGDRALGYLYNSVYGAIDEQGIENFYDISDSLHDRKETMYIDFCHLAEQGNEVIASRMADTLLPMMGGAVSDGSPRERQTTGDSATTSSENLPRKSPAILHLSMDASSPTVLDTSRSQYHQLFRDLTGNPNIDTHSVPGKYGTALTFDGLDDYIVIPAHQIGHVFSAGTVSDFSVAFWWRAADVPFENGYKAVLGNYDTANGGILLYQRGKPDGSSNRIYMNFYVAGSAAPILGPSTKSSDNINIWHHYVFQREGSTLRAWCDGVLQGTLTDDAVYGSMGNGNPFRLNAKQSGVAGALDEFRVYDRALAESEIKKLAANP